MIVIYKRGAIYHYDFRFTLKKDGTREHYRIRQSAGTSNKEDARDVENAHRKALKEGKIHPLDAWPQPTATGVTTAPTLCLFSKRFLIFVRVKRPRSFRFYSGCLGRLLNFAALADAPLSQITDEMSGQYARYRMEVCDNEVVSVNGDIRTLRRVMRVAAEWGVLLHAPAIHELPGAMGRDRILDWGEEARYLAAATPNLRDAAIILLDTGARPDSECFPMCWTHLDLVPRPETPFGVWHVRGTKSDAAERSVPLTSRVAEVLQRRKRDWDAKPEGVHSPYVFPGDGNSGHLVSLQQVHAKAVERAKLEWFVPYSLRHTFGTRCAQSGIDRYSLARLMGHSSPTITARYYIHITEVHIATGFQLFANYLAKGVAAGIAAFPEASGSVQ